MLTIIINNDHLTITQVIAVHKYRIDLRYICFFCYASMKVACKDFCAYTKELLIIYIEGVYISIVFKCSTNSFNEFLMMIK